VAVFAAADAARGTERLVVLAETRETDEGTRAELRSAIVATTVDLLGTPPDDVVLVPPRSIPKTSSGKIRRAASRAVYERGGARTPSKPAWWQIVRFGLHGARPSARRAARATGAVVFNCYAWMVLATAAVPVLLLLLVVPRRAWRWAVARGATRMLARLTGTRLTVHGLDRIPAGASIVAANHPSWLDGLVLALALPPRFRFVAGEVFGHRVVSGFVLRRVGAVFVERHDPEQGAIDTEKLVSIVMDGDSLVVFPEGALARAPGLRPFHMGAFVVAARAGVPVVPVAIRGTRSIFRPGHRFFRRGAVHVALDEPIHALGTDWAAAVALQLAVRDAILHRCGEPSVA
jgi:1-acyl-sn-glycerol-3-phosphate acyltransferase